jgi:hypothetical protein
MLNCVIVWVIASVAFAMGWAMCAGIVNNKLRANETEEEKRAEIRNDRIRSRDMGE